MALDMTSAAAGCTVFSTATADDGLRKCEMACATAGASHTRASFPRLVLLSFLSLFASFPFNSYLTLVCSPAAAFAAGCAAFTFNGSTTNAPGRGTSAAFTSVRPTRWAERADQGGGRLADPADPATSTSRQTPRARLKLTAGPRSARCYVKQPAAQLAADWGYFAANRRASTVLGLGEIVCADGWQRTELGRQMWQAAPVVAACDARDASSRGEFTFSGCHRTLCDPLLPGVSYSGAEMRSLGLRSQFAVEHPPTDDSMRDFLRGAPVDETLAAIFAGTFEDARYNIAIYTIESAAKTSIPGKQRISDLGNIGCMLGFAGRPIFECIDNFADDPTTDWDAGLISPHRDASRVIVASRSSHAWEAMPSRPAALPGPCAGTGGSPQVSFSRRACESKPGCHYCVTDDRLPALVDGDGEPFAPKQCVEKETKAA